MLLLCHPPLCFKYIIEFYSCLQRLFLHRNDSILISICLHWWNWTNEQWMRYLWRKDASPERMWEFVCVCVHATVGQPCHLFDNLKLIPPPLATHLFIYSRLCYHARTYTHMHHNFITAGGGEWCLASELWFTHWWDLYNSCLYGSLINAFISDYPAECDKLRKDGFRSSQYYSQGPTFSDPAQSVRSLQEDEDDEIDKKVRGRENSECRIIIMSSHSEILPSSGYNRECIHL